MSELEKLKTQNAELADRIAKLEAAAKPAEPFKSEYRGPIDYTANATMPPSALRQMVNAIPESLIAELRADARKPNPVTEASSSTLRGTPSALPQKRGTGWRDEIPLSSPPGVTIADRLMDAQDEIDKVELALKLAKARMGKGEGA